MNNLLEVNRELRDIVDPRLSKSKAHKIARVKRTLHQEDHDYIRV